MHRTIKRATALLIAVSGIAAASGCGGGGGGAAPANVTGQVLLIGVGNPIVPSPAATVTIGGKSTTTDVNGNFTLLNVASDQKQIVVMATGAITLTQPLPTLKANANNALGIIYLSTTGYSSTVSGTVVRSDTLVAVAGAKVQINGQVAYSGADGAFSFTGLPEGLGGTGIQVGLITATGFEDKPVIIDPVLGASPPDNALGDLMISPPVGSIPGNPYNISGTVTLQGLTDFSATTVTLINKSTSATISSMDTGTDGTYGFWVAAGSYTVKAEHLGYQTLTKDVAITSPDIPQTVNFAMTP